MSSYVIKLTKVPYIEALENFETILVHNSTFSYQGEDQYFGNTQLSPRERASDPYGESGFFLDRDLADIQGSTDSEVGKLHGKEAIKRGFKKFTGKFSKKSTEYKYNINLRKVSDYQTLKSTGVDASLVHPIGIRDVIQSNFICIKDSIDRDSFGEK